MSGSRPSPKPAGRADELVEAAAAVVLGHLGDHVWATGETTWSQALGTRLGELGWTLAVVEIGTGGSLGALLGDEPWLRFDESIASESPAARSHGGDDARATTTPTTRRPARRRRTARQRRARRLRAARS